MSILHHLGHHINYSTDCIHSYEESILSQIVNMRTHNPREMMPHQQNPTFFFLLYKPELGHLQILLSYPTHKKTDSQRH